jgi:hypothetical protein
MPEKLPCKYPGLIVFQDVYTPPSKGDKDRYIYHAKLHDPIVFWRENGECGFSITELLNGRVTGMKNPDTPVAAFLEKTGKTGETGTSISIRILVRFGIIGFQSRVDSP